jgi:translation initiation factor SUI1
VPSGTESAAVKQALAPEYQVNINKSDDPYYRYKCPQLVTTCANANASKMVKTTLCNVEDVARSLQRPPSYIVNYIGYSWSAKSEYRPGQKSYVSGNYTAEALDEVVSQFVQEWVLCPQCHNPELNLEIVGKKRGRSVLLTCSACGYSAKQKPEIMSALPKMTTHILKHPPAAKTGTQQIERHAPKPDGAQAAMEEQLLAEPSVVMPMVSAAQLQKSSKFYGSDSEDEDESASDDDSSSETCSDTDIKPKQASEDGSDSGSDDDSEGDSRESKSDQNVKPKQADLISEAPKVLVFGESMSAKSFLHRLTDANEDTCTDPSVEFSSRCARLAEQAAAAELTAAELQLIADRFEFSRGSSADFGLFLDREVHDGPGISAMRDAQQRLRRKQKGKKDAKQQAKRSGPSLGCSNATSAVVTHLSSERRSHGVVHLRVQMRNGRKSITTVSNLDLPSVKLKMIGKGLQTHCRCAVSVAADKDFGHVLQLQGDHRAAVESFLLNEEIVDREHLMIHGW